MKEKILGMTAGRELDALVAEKVMNYSVAYDGSGLCMVDWEEVGYGYVLRHFNPSESISVAWEIVEKFGEMLVRRRLSGTDYRAWIQVDLYGKREVYAHGKTAPLAICKCALFAVMK